MMKFLRSAPAVLIASGALLLSVTGGAVAGALITSSQIKDNTIRSVDVRNGTLRSVDVKDGTLKRRDISAAARAALRGNTGPQGPAGPPGATGPAGANGVSGFERITVTSAAIPVNGTGQLDASCPAGKKVVGAVIDWTANTDPATIRSLTDASVRGFGRNESGGDDTLILTIYCVIA